MFLKCFLNCERFSNIDAACTELLNKLTKIINEIAPSKETRTKTSNQDWFDREVAGLIHVQEKLFLKFKKSKLGIKFKTLIKKEVDFYETNLEQKIKYT